MLTHQGRQLLTVQAGDDPVWPEVVARFEEMLPDTFGEVFALGFSTSSAVDRMAGRVVPGEVVPLAGPDRRALRAGR
ncbi:hypothetical protein [Actinoplanes regularis]|uniref:hypothetical protein n=1 Tax=Actinoplanes regularis TaxID=52697 RepID=UPI0024A09B67|nr:hypothetical protein [Actinoplanes regularis]GLW34386.1 hypothetical protein Areg01_73230 [Actinoplanes regularis]